MTSSYQCHQRRRQIIEHAKEMLCPGMTIDDGLPHRPPPPPSAEEIQRERAIAEENSKLYADKKYCRADDDVIEKAYEGGIAAAEKHGHDQVQTVQQRRWAAQKIVDGIMTSSKTADCDKASLNVISFLLTGLLFDKAATSDQAFVRNYLQSNRVD
jgi:hypothetical protein